MKESNFQKNLISEIRSMFQGCLIMKTDPSYKQGLPDLLILYKSKWAALECKRSANASIRPNQKFYIDLLNKMSFARFIYPENKNQVLSELQRAFTRKLHYIRIKKII